MKTAFVYIGGISPPKMRIEALELDADYVICADSGLESAMAHGMKVDRYVGDSDSLSDMSLLTQLPPEAVTIYPRDKDYTDTELGLMAAQEWGADQIVMIGGGGGRLDHLYGLYMLLERPLYPHIWLTDSAEIRPITRHLRLTGLKGRTISFFPLCGVCRMKSRGLRWPLDRCVWRRGDIGVSNIAIDDVVEVTMQSGRLLYIHPWNMEDETDEALLTTP